MIPIYGTSLDYLTRSTKVAWVMALPTSLYKSGPRLRCRSHDLRHRFRYNRQSTKPILMSIPISDAQTTINSLDTAINFINDQRSNLGAVQNRLDFVNSNLMSAIQNTESSLSTIRDADFALKPVT